MSLADEIKKLESLRWNGSLTDEEFERAKAALLAQLTPPPTDEVVGLLGPQLAEVRYQNELARIDREWEQERDQFLITDKNGHKHVPTVASSVGGAVVAGVFGLIWTGMAVGITSGAPNFGAFAFAKVLFPAVGVLVTVGGIYAGVTGAKKAEAYNQAFAAYQQRRAAVRADDFRG